MATFIEITDKLFKISHFPFTSSTIPKNFLPRENTFRISLSQIQGRIFSGNSTTNCHRENTEITGAAQIRRKRDKAHRRREFPQISTQSARRQFFKGEQSEAIPSTSSGCQLKAKLRMEPSDWVFPGLCGARRRGEWQQSTKNSLSARTVLRSLHWPPHSDECAWRVYVHNRSQTGVFHGRPAGVFQRKVQRAPGVEEV